MNQTERFIIELRQETEATGRLLERVPPDKLSWKPHPKSMSLGQLALHIAGLPGGIAELLDERIREVPFIPLPEAESVEEILSALDQNTALAEARIRGWGDSGLAEIWTLTSDGVPVLETPRIEMVRSLMLNHWYHHRGQLTVYLRLLGVPVPSLYGPSADETA